MSIPLQASLKIGASGLEAQSRRLRVLSENLANAQSTGNTPGADPYARKVISFESRARRGAGANLVKVAGIDRSPRAVLRIEHNPGHPAADAKGFVKLPNVDILVEVTDMREANRSYEANLQVIKQAREMISMTIDLLRNAHDRRDRPPSRRSASRCGRQRPERGQRGHRRRSARPRGADFAAMLGQMSSNLAGAMRTSEAQSIAGIKGQGLGAAGGRGGDVGRADSAEGNRRPRQGGRRLSRNQPDADLRRTSS